ncbi:MAG: hypothetical protein M3N14_03650, partial [Bacteroidota bacterium]|nr:hypothetical protein [Bacteroidota bacterium]
METIQLILYEFAELSDKAKEKAVKEFADINVNDDWYAYTIEDFKNICETIGITVNTKKTYFRGFYSQGDGSTFQAIVNIPQLVEAVKYHHWKEYAPTLEFGFTIPDLDKRLIKLIQNESLDISPKITGVERWYSVTADLSYNLPYTHHQYSRIETELEKLEAWLQTVADILNRYLYKSLQAEYEYQTKEETVMEAIEVNEYQFTTDGVSATRIKNLTAIT